MLGILMSVSIVQSNASWNRDFMIHQSVTLAWEEGMVINKPLLVHDYVRMLDLTSNLKIMVEPAYTKRDEPLLEAKVRTVDGKRAHISARTIQARRVLT